MCNIVKAKRLIEEEKAALLSDPVHGDVADVTPDGAPVSKKKKKSKKDKKKTQEDIEKDKKRAEDRNLFGDDTMFLDETQIWYQDFYSLFWNKWYRGDNRNLYLVIQVLQLKTGIQPSNAGITKQLLAREYDLIGYGTEQLTFGDGKVKYGEFEIPLYKGPIYA